MLQVQYLPEMLNLWATQTTQFTQAIGHPDDDTPSCRIAVLCSCITRGHDRLGPRLSTYEWCVYAKALQCIQCI